MTNGANYAIYVYSYTSTNNVGYGGWNWTGIVTPAAPPTVPLNVVALRLLRIFLVMKKL